MRCSGRQEPSSNRSWRDRRVFEKSQGLSTSVIGIHHVDYYLQKRSDVRELSMSLLILGEIGRFMCVQLDQTSSDY